MATTSSKSNLSPAALLIAVLAALGLASPGSRSGETKPTGSNLAQTTTERSEKSEERSAEDLILEFFDEAPEQFETDQKWSAGDAPPDQFQTDQKWSTGDAPCSMAEPNCWREGDSHYRYSLRFLVATIPEPDSPLLSYKFDAQLDAIEAAAATAHYVPDRFYLPWLKKKSTSDSNETSTGKLKRIELRGSHDGRKGKTTSPLGVTITAKYEESEDEHRADKHPGLMLFRDSVHRNLLLVFLVGESPTRGVNKSSLRSSLNQVAWLSGWRSGDWRYPDTPNEQIVRLACAADPLNIKLNLLGPTFSGSAISLKLTLDSWLESFASVRATSPCPASPRSRPVGAQADSYLRPQVTIISGSATGSREVLNDPPRILYQTVRLPDSETIPVLINDLLSRLPGARIDSRRRLFQNSQQADMGIAFLIEDTGYGANVYSETASNRVLYLPFPLHISDLRTAVDQSGVPGAQPQVSLRHRDLSLAADSGDDNVEDVPPSFSKRSAVYDELVLSKLLSTIVRERVRYVGIAATDIEDLIFLVHEIRVNCPETTIFVTSSDLRFLHTDVNHDLTGTIVFSNYPLFSMSQRWVWPFAGNHTQIQFPTDMAEGAYNATLALLDDPIDIVDYGMPLGATDHSKYPVLWESVVGHDDIWPVKEFTAFDVNWAVRGSVYQRDLPPMALAEVAPRVSLELYPVSFQFAFVALSIACFVAAKTLITPPPTFLLGNLGVLGWLRRILRDPCHSDWIRQRRLLLVTFAVALLTVYLTVAGFALMPIVVGYRLEQPLDIASQIVIVFTIAFVVILIICALGRTGRNLADSRPGPRERPLALILLLSFGLIELALSSLLVVHLGNQGLADGLFAFLRSASLWDGISELLPLAFAGIAGFALLACHLDRLRLLEDSSTRTDNPPPQESFLGFETESFVGIGSYERKITKLLECHTLELTSARGVLVGLLVGLLYYVGRFWLLDGDPFRTIDGWQFFCLFAVISTSVYGFFAFLVLRFLVVWAAVDRLLRRLYWHPSRTGYEELRRCLLPGRPEDQRITVFEPPPSRTAVEGALQYARTLLHRANELVRNPPAFPDAPHDNIQKRLRDNVIGLRVSIRDAEESLFQLLEFERNGKVSETVEQRRRLQGAMSRLSCVVLRIFEPEWRARAQPFLVTISLSKGEQEDSEEDELVAQANLFVAARVVDFLRHVFPQLLNLVGFAMTGVLAMMMAVSAYPFPRHEAMLWFSWIVLLGMVAISITTFVQMNRDRIISMLSGTDPGRLNWDSVFISHMLFYAIIPILTLVGAQFPHSLSGVFSWIGGFFGGGSK